MRGGGWRNKTTPPSHRFLLNDRRRALKSYLHVCVENIFGCLSHTNQFLVPHKTPSAQTCTGNF